MDVCVCLCRAFTLPVVVLLEDLVDCCEAIIFWPKAKWKLEHAAV